MKKLFFLAIVLFSLGFVSQVDAKEAVTLETYQAMLREYYADEIKYFESQGEVVECVAFGKRLFVRYAPGTEDVGMNFMSNLYKWMNANGYTSVEIYIGDKNFWVVQV